jgi:putative intracellular protease/amidase
MEDEMLRKLLKLAGAVVLFVAVLALAGYAHIRSLGLDEGPQPNLAAMPADLPWLDQPAQGRGRILAVVTSLDTLGGKKAGYELTELARAYYIFKANGFEVEIASPAGGKPSARQDRDDMQNVDYAFLNDPEAQLKANNTLALRDIDPQRYRAVFFVGGKGAMGDFPGNPDIQRIVAAIAPSGVVGAVCHGPAALLGVKVGGKDLIAGKQMTGFTNEEELFLIPDARERFGFLLEDRARTQGGKFIAGPQYLANTVVDGRLVTGQNPWSTWGTAEAMVQAMGYEPVKRERTAEELSVRALHAYHEGGLEAARERLKGGQRFDKMLLVMHSVIAAMQWRIGDAINLQRLVKT